MNGFAKDIEAWYDAHRRDLPWRDTHDPYLIWVSEIILQQTRVEQGLNYYLRFVRRFPDVKSLAEADEDEVLSYWQGLGYYSRARNMHQAARSMEGVFPVTYEGVRMLKGVGDYTAAAICSFAYNMPLAVVDGNVYRVLARYLGIDTPIDSTQGIKLFRNLAQELLDKRNPSLYNQAIMDFGALQCTHGRPHCEDCPLQETCVAFREGKTGELPVKAHKTQQTFRYFHYLLIRQGAYTFINKRTGDDIWKNLYELPLVETSCQVVPDPKIIFSSWGNFSDLTRKFDFTLVRQGVKHVLSHRIIQADFYLLVVPEEEPLTLPSSFLKVRCDQVGNYAFPVLVDKFLRKYL